MTKIGLEKQDEVFRCLVCGKTREETNLKNCKGVLLCGNCEKTNIASRKNSIKCVECGKTSNGGCDGGITGICRGGE